MEKSIILPWSKENIEKSPEECGVLMLRTTPVNGDITIIKTSINLKKDLLDIIEKGVSAEVKYFDWLTTEDTKTAEEAKLELKKKYHLEGILD